MSLTTATNKATYTGNGSTTVFALPYLVYDATHVQVYLNAVLQGSGYTVSGVGNAGGVTITFSVAPLTDVLVTLQRVVPLTQLAIYDVAGAFPAKTTEKNFDLSVMRAQQHETARLRSLRQAAGDGADIATLPLLATRANKYLTFNSSGNPTATDAATASGTSVLATGTSLARLLADRFAEIFNVEDYSGSDTVKIQAAITAAASAGSGLILLGNKEYTITSAFTGLGSDVTFLGVGLARLKKAFNGNLFTTGTAKRVVFHNVNVNADGDNYTGSVLVLSTGSEHIKWLGGRVTEGADAIFTYEGDGGYESLIADAVFGLSSTNLAAGAVVKNSGVDTLAMPRIWRHCFTLASTWFYRGTGLAGFYADTVYSAGFDFTGSTSLGCTLKSCRLAIGVSQVARMDGNNILVSDCLLGGDVTIQTTLINSRFIDNIMDNSKVFTCSSPSVTSEIRNPKTPLGYTGADATPTVAGVKLLVLSNGGAVTITNLDDGIDQQEVTLKFSDANTTIQDGTNFQLSGGANFVGTTDDTLTVVKFGSVWYEKCRSVN